MREKYKYELYFCITMTRLIERMRIGPKGQVVIPIYFRKKYNISPGDEVIVEETENGVLIGKPAIDIVKIAENAAKHINAKKRTTDADYYEQIEQRYKRTRIH